MPSIQSGGGVIKMSADHLDGKMMIDTLIERLRYYTPRQVEEHIEKLTTPESDVLKKKVANKY